MSRISRSKSSSCDLPLRLLPVRREGDLEALLLERVADRLADRGLVVDDEDAILLRAAVGVHATGVGVGLAARRRTQKVLPSPGLGMQADLAAHHVHHSLRDREPEPEALAFERCLTPIEALEDPILLLGRDSLPGVLYLDRHGVLGPRGRREG